MEINKKQLDILNSLSDKERGVVKNILNQISLTNNSQIYNDLIYADYKEIPVDIETFITDDRYLGKAWKDATGNLKMYPFWMNELKKIFPTNIDTNYETILETGARGLGKSEIACGAICTYLMYRVLCLKNPLEYYHLKSTEKICFAFMNITLALSEKIAINIFQKTIQMSPWFMSRGKMTSYNNMPYWLPPAPLDIIIGSQSDDVIGQAIFFAFFDEISFLKNQDLEKQKTKALDMIHTAVGGMKTRFIYKGKNPTVLVVASSKRSEQSFMEAYIRLLSKEENQQVYVIDKPVWEVKPKGTYSEDFFYVGLGNKFLENIIIPVQDETKLDIYKLKGYQIIKVPINFKQNAIEDLNRMLTDYAGISTFASNKFLSASRLSDIIDNTISNPFPDVIEVGNGPDDIREYKNFFNMDKLDKSKMHFPLFIHLDLSKSGDKTGIAGVWIIGKKPTSDGNPGKDLMFQPAFSVSIKAPTGREISFEKDRNFIRWLKEVGFKIKKITADTFQSADTLQILSAEKFETAILSVDRTENVPGEQVKICKPYQYLKNVIYEKRLKLYKDDLLYTELVQLEKNINTGKVDHPQNGSKDQADALCGAIYTASTFADEFAYDYGEDVENAVSVNKSSNPTTQQITVDFENELARIGSKFYEKHQEQPKSKETIDAKNVPKKTNTNDAKTTSVQNTGVFSSNGIMIW